MLEGAKSIGAGAATIALAGAAIGIGNVFSSFRNQSLAKQLFGYASLIRRILLAFSFSASVMGFLSIVRGIMGYAPLGEANPSSSLHLIYLCLTNPDLLFIFLFLIFLFYFHVKDTEQKRENFMKELVTHNRSKGAIHSISYGWKGVSVAAHHSRGREEKEREDTVP